MLWNAKFLHFLILFLCVKVEKVSPRKYTKRNGNKGKAYIPTSGQYLANFWRWALAPCCLDRVSQEGRTALHLLLQGNWFLHKIKGQITSKERAVFRANGNAGTGHCINIACSLFQEHVNEDWIHSEQEKNHYKLLYIKGKKGKNTVSFANGVCSLQPQVTGLSMGDILYNNIWLHSANRTTIYTRACEKIWHMVFMNFKELAVFSFHSNIPYVPWRDCMYRLHKWLDCFGVFTHDAELR